MNYEEVKSRLCTDQDKKEFNAFLPWASAYCLFLGVGYLINGMNGLASGLMLFAAFVVLYTILKAVTDPFHKKHN